MTFEQNPQFKKGRFYEQELDKFFAPEFEVVEMCKDLERLAFGDRLFIHKRTGKKFFIEYKSDESTFRTGNLFIETISVDIPTQEKQGWAYTCRSDFIIYYLPLNHKILIFKTNTIRFNIDQWRKDYPEAKTGNEQNNGYNTHGVLLPLQIAEQYTCKIIADIEGVEYAGN